MNIFLPKHKAQTRGMVLILALVITSIILLFGLDIANISAKQLYLSSFNKNSETALFMADAMFECVYYWDITVGTGADGRRYFPSPGGSATSGSLSCMGRSIKPSTAPNPGPNDAIQYTTVGQSGAQVTKLKIIPSGNISDACATSIVTKTGAGVTIDVYGQNTCDPTQPRRVERGFRIQY
ncbi:MAG: hypothetical protein ACYC8S_02000 [Minisyncoccota bacterium]